MKNKQTSKLIIAFLFCCNSITLFCQKLPTVSELIDRQVENHGGTEKINGIANSLMLTAGYSETHREDNKAYNIIVNTASIMLSDYKNKVRVAINYDYEKKLYTLRFVDANGKMISRVPNGNEIESPSAFSGDNEFLAALTTAIIPEDAKVEQATFDNREVYSVSYVEDPTEKNEKYIHYFDKSTGFQVGLVLTIPMYSEGVKFGESTTVSIYDTKIDSDKISTKTTTITKDASNIVSIYSETYSEIYHNIDTKDFKKECFQKPNKCYSKYLESIKLPTGNERMERISDMDKIYNENVKALK